MTEALPSPLESALTIHQRMVLILAELPAIGKTQENKQQGFHYRGHDDVMNALNPLLAQHGVFFVPQVLERVTAERKTRQGSTLYEVNLHVQYSFYGAGGDSFTASAWGEGTDSGDKSTNKAMTMALKNVLAQTFALATAELSDADAETPEETTGRAERRLGTEFRELEALIEEVKTADPDPAHGGGYYYQVAVNAAAKYHEKRLEDLAAGEIHDLERRFRGLLEGFGPTEEKPAGELPLEESINRVEGPQVKVPQNWAEVKEAIDSYHADLWPDFRAFVEQAGAHLFPDVPNEQERTKAQRDVLFQKAAGVTVRLLETHDPGEMPPPVRIELQAHWAKALDGQVLPGPDWSMDPEETAAGRPARAESPKPEGSREEEAGASQPPAEGAAADATVPPTAPDEASPSPLEQTVTDAPLTDAEQEVLAAVAEEFKDPPAGEPENPGTTIEIS